MLLELALALAQAAEPVAVERIEGADPQEVAAFEEAARRFGERMEEFTSDVREIVDRREAEERERILRRYGRLQDELKAQERAYRDQAMAQFRAFLEKYPDSPQAAHVMFRLADLEFEVAGEAFLEASEAYEQQEAAAMAEGRFDLPPPPLKDLSVPIALYRRIIEEHPDYRFIDGTWYMLGFCLGDSLAEQFDPDASIEAYRTLVERYPDSQFAVDGMMRLGEYYFDENRTEESIPYYEAVVAAGPEHRLYDRGLYKLAWAHYKLDHYDQALELFTKLLDYSEEVRKESGAESAMAPEALQYMAISFSDLSDVSGDPPYAIAEAWFESVGERSYEHDVFERLAEVLHEQARYEYAIETYLYLQERWPLHPKNPEYMYKVATLHVSKPLPEPDEAARARALLAERYGEGTAWWQANFNHPDARDKARGYIEESLASVAIELHLHAQQTGDPADFAAAAAKYREYLDRFPFADDFYEISWYLADALRSAGRLDEAEEAYRALARAKGHPYIDGSRWNLFKVITQKLELAYGAVDVLPEDAEVEKMVPTKGGGERPVYRLDPLHREYIEMADALAAATFEDPTYAEVLDQQRPALLYNPAVILHVFGHFEESRPRLEEVIQRYPDRDEAAYAAKLLVASYQVEEDWPQVRQLTARFSSRVLGSTVAEATASEFSTIREEATYKIAYELAQAGKRREAAEAFLAFTEEFPDSRYVKEALFSAANNFDLAGDKHRAIELFERYINTWPRDDRSKGLHFLIASSYADVLELEQAVRYYERLYRYFPDYVDAPTALYMAAFLRTGMGDAEGAAKLYEEYAKRYPDQPDALATLWLAGEQWERVGDREALAFYRRYLKEHAGEDPDHTLEAARKVADLLERTGARRRQVDRAKADLLRLWEELSARAEIGPRARHLVAEVAFEPVWAAFEKFQEIEYPADQEAMAKLLLETKLAELEALTEDTLALIKTYQDFEISSACLYVQGAALLAYADMLFNAPPPEGFTEEMIEIYQDALYEKAEPIQEKAIKRLKANVDKAREVGRTSVWVDRSLELLHELDPRGWPVPKPEAIREIETTIYPLPSLPSAGPQDEGAPPAPPEAVPATGEEVPAPAEEVPAPTEGGEGSPASGEPGPQEGP